MVDQLNYVLERRLLMTEGMVTVNFETRPLVDVLTDLNSISGGDYKNG